MGKRWMLVLTVVGLVGSPPRVAAQHEMHAAGAEAATSRWRSYWMAQVFPIVTAGEPFGRDTHLNRRESYLTQPVVMAGLESPGSRVALRLTLDFEQITQPDGEFTFGGWGEGFIDKRHPHTLVHELMVSVNAWESAAGSFSVSAGKGFAPYGTEDPMSRPVVKYPTNHHLSQVLERWTLNAVWLHRSGWSLETGVFGGNEPQNAYDFSNIESFGNSWSARLAKRTGSWETSLSYARITEEHGDENETTRLANAAVRYAGSLGSADAYALLEASRSDPQEDDGFWSVLLEAQLTRSGHEPYLRLEYATRPEFHRNGAPGTDDFFRYDHDTHADGATRWWITTLGYGFTPPASGRVSARPFVELQHNRVSVERGDIDPAALFGHRSFWSVSAGFRVFLGGGPMRMGTYGVLDSMATSPAPAGPAAAAGPTHRHDTAETIALDIGVGGIRFPHTIYPGRVS